MRQPFDVISIDNIIDNNHELDRYKIPATYFPESIKLKWTYQNTSHSQGSFHRAVTRCYYHNEDTFQIHLELIYRLFRN